MSIGSIISERRKELGLTQKQLAEKLNITDRTVSRWECEVNLPDVEMLKSISKVLGVPITYFYEDSPKKAFENSDILYKQKARIFNRATLISIAVLVLVCLVSALFVYFGYVASQYSHFNAALPPMFPTSSMVGLLSVFLILITVSVMLQLGFAANYSAFYNSHGRNEDCILLIKSNSVKYCIALIFTLVLVALFIHFYIIPAVYYFNYLPIYPWIF